MHFRNPMLVGLAGYIVAEILLINIPEEGYALILLAVLLIETCSYAIVGTQIDRMLVVTVDAQERARIMAILLVVQVAATSPFGWIAGMLSSANRNYPFILNIVLFAIGLFLVYRAARLTRGKEPQVQPAAAD